ncbi:MAG: 2-oxoacid:acceptor oxidoreductase subunit alpha [Candidatus Marinimicrobia bacterium]|nr:2-oxoacid:acceptor oxidoreductase subunit alpha [Candidatus Neomarinimicrobiota bacterium]
MAKSNGDQPDAAEIKENLENIDSATVRFAGDSGDGMQLAGTQFSNTTAIFGNDLSTLPDFPAEIRAPAGSLPGVSGFQICFSSHDVMTPGDEPDAMVIMNPAALKMNVGDLQPGGILIVNEDAFKPLNIQKAGYDVSPLEDGSLSEYRLIKIPITTLTLNALEDFDLNNKIKERSKNFTALGIVFWLYDRPLQPTIEWVKEKFAKVPNVAEANITALKTGNNFASTARIFTSHYSVKKAKMKKGKYRNITGNEATALGYVTAANLAGKQLVYASYPITPASDILHELAKHKSFRVKTIQAEDEIAAICAALGAAYTGSIGITGTSGPGLALKSEAINLALMAEIPIVISNVQRGGPSTGLPTKTEQADLLQAMFGRNSDSSLPIVAASTPADCFKMAFEAVRLAVESMSPVIFLTDGYLGSGSEPFKVPDVADLPRIEIKHHTDPKTFAPYLRDMKTFSRPWAVPGTPGLEHRLGGLEKADGSGDVSYDPANHELMTMYRHKKVESLANSIPLMSVTGPKSGKLLVLGWGSTFGAISAAVKSLSASGVEISSTHLNYLNPFPKNLGKVLNSFEKVLIPEINLGQLALLIKARFGVRVVQLNKVKGKPFLIHEISDKILEVLKGN